MGIIRILFLADTHLGFDLPFRPRIQRRRRGPEFFANFERALRPALRDRVDCVVQCIAIDSKNRVWYRVHHHLQHIQPGFEIDH
jgi:hypothetical protein